MPDTRAAARPSEEEPIAAIADNAASLRRMVDALDELIQATSIADAVTVVRDAARDLTGADGITVILRDGDDCHYVEEDAIAPLWKGRRFPMAQCVSGWVMIHREPVTIPDIYADPRVPLEAYRDTFVKSMAMVPIGRREAVGAIGAYWRTQTSASPEMLSLLGKLADGTASVLEQVRLRTRLEESEARFRLMADTSPIMIWATDREGRVEFVNRAYQEFFGRTEADIRTHGWAGLVHSEDAPRYAQAFAAAASRGTSFHAEARVRRADGAWRWIASYASPRFGEQGQVIGMVGSSPDVTEMHEALAQARDAGRLKDEFLAMVAHELRQPVHASVAALRLMEARIGREPGERARAVVERQVQQMSRLVGDLLESARIVRGEVELQVQTLDLAPLIRHVIDATTPALGEREQQLRVDVADEPLLLRGDAMRLEQVLMNLLSNASKYSHAGSRIAVDASRIGPEVLVSVTDNGKGIEPALLPHIFELFVRGTTAGSGFGIGLAVSRRIVELHGGSMEAHSDGPGLGSRFVVRLPAA
ncbi:MAG: PAS domain S-box protein [Acidobacteria bacterium]|nr:PAS domain S-box protein [Acidobacteriota bacterium]